ncbi:hypothetical protein KO353_00270 [Elioraea tepida]|uniref:Sel1 repeat family protein n=1 Tax=Elioraea tepida TaxID=2843330 RepID=A0A975U1Z6_9PROT|nr:hypothetical protein [Elioraea tepida]QXM24765.1 hypothetical protein KO353_00270 [Elioraea tepida]
MATPERRAGGAGLSPGARWVVLEGAVICDTRSRGDLVLVHPEKGLALFQFEPRWTPDALAWLTRRLEETGFTSAFPGRLPAIHRRLRREHLPELATILAEAFSLQPALTLPPGGAWVEALRRVLCVPQETSPETARPERREVTHAPSAAREAPAVLASQTGSSEAGGQPTRTTADAAQAVPRRRSNVPLAIGAGALAAGLVVIAALRGPSPQPTEPPDQPLQVAANVSSTMRTDAGAPSSLAAAPVVESGGAGSGGAGAATPGLAENGFVSESRVRHLLASSFSDLAALTTEPVEEPPEPALEAALAALARDLGPRPEPIEEPPEPALEAALAALARDIAPRPEPIEEPPEPALEAALAALARDIAPRPEPIEEPPAPELEAALAALARDLAPRPEPVEEPPEPELEAALAALAREMTAARTTSPQAVTAPALPAAEAPIPLLPVPDPPAVVGAMLLRGEALLSLGDISGARKFFERAAASANASAALAMGGTYDPGVLARLGARGITPDRDMALAWYRYAASLGETRAAERIRALEGSR